MENRHLENGCGTKQYFAVDNHSPKISIITQHYNIDEHYLRRAIESILNQTFTDFEYYISDNASTDNTAAILDEYAAKDSRVRVIHQIENIPRKASRNIIMNFFKGEYIAYLDNDDYYEPDFLEEMYTIAKKTDADLVACGTEMYKEDDRQQRGIRSYHDIYLSDFKNISDIFEDVVWVAFATVWCKLLKLKIVKDMYNGDVFRDFKSNHDTMFCLAYAQRSKSLAITSKVLHHYCMRSNSMVSKWNKEQLILADGTYILFKQCLKMWGIETLDNAAFISSVLIGNVIRILNSINNDSCVNIPNAFEILCDIVNDHLLYEAINNTGGDYKILNNVFSTGADLISKIRSNEERQKIHDNFLYKVCKLLYIARKDTGSMSENDLNDYLDALYSQENKFQFGKQYLLHAFGSFNREMCNIINACGVDYVLDKKEFLYSLLHGREQCPIIMNFVEENLLQKYITVAYDILNKHYSSAFERINGFLEGERDPRARVVLLEAARNLTALEDNSEGFVTVSKLEAEELINIEDYKNAAELILELEKMLPRDEDLLFFRLKLLIRTNFIEDAQKLANEIAYGTVYTDEYKAKVKELLCM